jgi:hypothetical protein
MPDIYVPKLLNVMIFHRVLAGNIYMLAENKHRKSGLLAVCLTALRTSLRSVACSGIRPRLGSEGALALVNAELIGQTRQRHILGHSIVGNQQI